MSSYFDKLANQVQELSRSWPNTKEGNEAFLLAVVLVESDLIITCELFAGDVETPQDCREAVMTCIHCNQVRYEGGDFLGSKLGGTLCESHGAQYACACRSSKLVSEMHGLWHDIARMRYRMRYGLVMDDPGHAIKMRDKFVEERGSSPHPWQNKPPTAGSEPLRFSDYRPPTPRRETQRGPELNNASRSDQFQ